MPTRKKALVVVRTYPTPAKKGVEVSCTAAITEHGEWLRIFPVPYRLLDVEQRFHKYQWVEVDVEKASDTRPESFRLIQNSIKPVDKPLGTNNYWRDRKMIVEPMRAHCLCCLQEERDRNGSPTLGLIKPKRIRRLIIESDEATWTAAQLGILRQGDLFQEAPARELEKIPYKFSYEFSCDDKDCSGHRLMCTDWEMGESWRSWKQKYGHSWEKYFRQKYETELLNSCDLSFFVGTVHQHPDAWIIVGLFYPPKEPELPLFVNL